MAHGRRRHRGGHEGGHENAERWLLTYADLITLLMVFFVVLYSMSSADATKFQKISAALQQAFNLDVLQGQSNSAVLDGASQPAPPVDDLINNNDVPEVNRLQSGIDAALQGQSQTPDVSVGTDKEGVVVRLSGSYLFDSGRAELKPNSLAVLDAIANELKLQPNQIRVDGHTDSTPIDSPRYPTNWELSTARALAVTRYFTETDGIAATRLMAAGFGEFRPLVPNDTREHRAMNRRVEIHLLSSIDPNAPDMPATTTTTSTTSTTSTTPTLQPTGATEYLEP
jgi:chemotaxis protein MotB